jgi:hypothetical protein
MVFLIKGEKASITCLTADLVLKKNTKNLTKIIIYVWFYQIDKRMQIDQV